MHLIQPSICSYDPTPPPLGFMSYAFSKAISSFFWQDLLSRPLPLPISTSLSCCFSPLWLPFSLWTVYCSVLLFPLCLRISKRSIMMPESSLSHRRYCAHWGPASFIEWPFCVAFKLHFKCPCCTSNSLSFICFSLVVFPFFTLAYGWLED